MTQYEREELVERYLSGEMTSAQEGEFFLVAAVDEELQRTLKAYRIMDRAMMNDRDVAVTENSQYRNRVMGMLAASHVAGVGGPGSETPRPGVETPGPDAPSGGGFWRGFGASILGASLVAGMIVAISSVNDDATPANAVPVQQTSPAAAAPAPGGTVTAPSASESSSPEVKESAPAARPIEQRELRSEGRSAAKQSAPRQSAPREAADAEGATKPTKRNDVIKLPMKDNPKVDIPIEVEDPNAPKK